MFSVDIPFHVWNSWLACCSTLLNPSGDLGPLNLWAFVYNMKALCPHSSAKWQTMKHSQNLLLFYSCKWFYSIIYLLGHTIFNAKYFERFFCKYATYAVVVSFFLLTMIKWFSTHFPWKIKLHQKTASTAETQKWFRGFVTYNFGPKHFVPPFQPSCNLLSVKACVEKEFNTVTSNESHKNV